MKIASDNPGTGNAMRRRRTFWRDIVSVPSLLRWMLVVLALAAAIAMQRQGEHVLMLVPSIVLAASLCGLSGGLVATVVSCAVAYGGVAHAPLADTAALGLSGVMISVLGAAWRRTCADHSADREAARSRLRDTESSLARAQRVAHMGSWELDIANGQLSWSDETFRIFGLVPGPEPVTYARFISHVHPDDRDYVESSRLLALQGEAPLNIEHRIVRADQEVRWVQEIREWYTDVHGQKERMTGIVLDITERKHAQLALLHAKETLEQTVVERTAQLQAALARAEAADQVKSAFLATMSHELRTPLNSIIGFTGILLQSLAGPLNAEQAKQLGMVQTSARHLLHLINDVLDISKLEARQMQIHAEPFDLAPVMEGVIASMRPQAQHKALTLAIALPDTPLRMVGDRRRVEQVLINLVSNAIKFTDAGGVTLSVDMLPRSQSSDPSLGNTIRMRVADTGIGINADNQSKVFMPFQQVDSGLARTHDGTGLGLAICSRLVELMGGSLSVESTLGTGSTFTVTLPSTLVATHQ